VKFEGAGTQTASFTLAVQEPSREGKAFVLYVGCVAYGKAAEACSTLNAEDLIAVQGRLTWRKQVRTCGQEHSVLSVSVREVAVLQAAEMPDVPTAARPVGW
jgi:single-stranded DNA-binding protein